MAVCVWGSATTWNRIIFPLNYVISAKSFSAKVQAVFAVGLY